jgi:hypothetical protein
LREPGGPLGIVAASSSVRSAFARRVRRALRLAACVGLIVTLHAALAQTTLAPLAVPADRVVRYFVAPSPVAPGAHPADGELATWALRTWEAALGGALVFQPSDESEALVRLYWAPAASGQYGEMRPLDVEGRRGAAVFVRPDTEALGPDIAARARADALFRDTIVYLTCLHELGHALGLAHTAEYADIMYAFGYGGDVAEYFGRFRRQLRARSDIPGASVLSEGDRRQLRFLYSTLVEGRQADAN